MENGQAKGERAEAPRGGRERGRNEERKEEQCGQSRELVERAGFQARFGRSAGAGTCGALWTMLRFSL